MSRIEVVVGGQFGSEGKGAIAGHLAGGVAQSGAPMLAMRVAGPNAGHTVVGRFGVDTTGSVAPNLCEPMDITTADGSLITADHQDYRAAFGHADRFAWRLRQVPVAAVTNENAVLAIAAGSEIDPDVLANEVTCLDQAGYNVSARLVIDHSVTVIEGRHKVAESSPVVRYDSVAQQSLTERIGSTGKGIGAARIERLARVPEVCLADNKAAWGFVHSFANTDDVANLAAGLLRASASAVVQIEGAQGYGLGLHAGYYPYCTSSDCRAIDFLAMAGISPWQIAAHQRDPASSRHIPELVVWVCVRPYPIRVGGNSGPLRDETSWERLGLPTEHTTVTGKVRRVGAWDGDLVRRAIRANGGPGGSVKVALTMFDSVALAVAGQTSFANLDMTGQIRDRLAFYEGEIGQRIDLVGTGPDTVIDLYRSQSQVATEFGQALVGDPTLDAVKR